MNERIRKLRRTLDLTQQEFADKIGVKRNTVATYELGRSVPSEAGISLMCREFNVNETWLRTGDGEMFNKMDAEDIAFNHFGYIMGNATAQKKAVLSALVEMVYCVPDDKWDYIFNQFESCLKEARENREDEGED
ncbi:helix-turn-helix domain-containing protein [Enterocloster lavalensis]|nr:helix-turn-helix transcriptional regulator [Enterocloster lavalensis]